MPQYSGTPGWIFLTQNDDGISEALFIDAKNTRTESLPVIIDERVCSDTILRAVKISKDLFLICDIFILNGVQIHGYKTYEERKQALAELLDIFHKPDLTAFIHVDDAPIGTVIRGYEYYDSLPGSIGIFLDTST
jgi:hypothetical protein